jgi:hypothetical protein
LKLAETNPQALRVISNSPNSTEMLDKILEMNLLRLSLRTESLPSDIVWIKSKHFEQARKMSEEEKVYGNKDDESTGQSEQTFEIPESPEAKKVLEKATPVNSVSFHDGKLVETKIFEPERLPRNTKYAGNREDLSQEDKDRRKLLLILTSLMRKRKA